MKLAIVGTGTVGETLTRGFIRARHDVALGARDPKRPVTWLGSLGEELQLALPDVRVVKTLNTMSAGVMADPGGLPAHSSVFVAGDDDGAKQTVAALLGDLGWPADSLIDLGGIAAARGPEHAFYLLGALFGALGTPRLNFAIIR